MSNIYPKYVERQRFGKGNENVPPGRGEPGGTKEEAMERGSLRMATSKRRRQLNRTVSDDHQLYVYGSAVRQAESQPVRRHHRSHSSRTRRASRQVMRNRHRAMRISPAYAAFLAVAAICAVLVCVSYLRLQSEVVNRSENITSLQEQLADLTEANNTAYNAATDSVNLETVLERAVNEMGMVYESHEYAESYIKRKKKIERRRVFHNM